MDFNASIFRRGQKKELFDETQEDAESLESELTSKVEELASLWAAERVGKELSAAIWRPAIGLAEVVLQRGKAVTHLGCQQRSKLYLHIEEAVYLMDRANLLLFIEKIGTRERKLLSLCEALDLMVASGVSMDVYLVFCKLQRSGYIVQRHPARWIAGPKEDLRAIWEHWRVDSKGSGEPALARAEATDCDARRPASMPQPPKQSTRLYKERKAATSRAWWAPVPLNWLPDVGQDEYWAGLPRAAIVEDPKTVARAAYPLMRPLAHGIAAEWRVPGGDQVPRLHLDVWDANAKFSRRGAGAPMFRVSVWSDERAPSVHEMAAVEMEAGDVHVKFAVIEKGDIGFYSFPHVCLQDIL